MAHPASADNYTVPDDVLACTVTKEKSLESRRKRFGELVLVQRVGRLIHLKVPLAQFADLTLLRSTRCVNAILRLDSGRGVANLLYPCPS